MSKASDLVYRSLAKYLDVGRSVRVWPNGDVEIVGYSVEEAERILQAILRRPIQESADE